MLTRNKVYQSQKYSWKFLFHYGEMENGKEAKRAITAHVLGSE